MIDVDVLHVGHLEVMRGGEDTRNIFSIPCIMQACNSNRIVLLDPFVLYTSYLLEEPVSVAYQIAALGRFISILRARSLLNMTPKAAVSNPKDLSPANL